MKIVSAATAFPRNYYSQEVLLAALQQYWNGKLENRNCSAGCTREPPWTGITSLSRILQPEFLG